MRNGLTNFNQKDFWETVVTRSKIGVKVPDEVPGVGEKKKEGLLARQPNWIWYLRYVRALYSKP